MCVSAHAAQKYRTPLIQPSVRNLVRSRRQNHTTKNSARRFCACIPRPRSRTRTWLMPTISSPTLTRALASAAAPGTSPCTSTCMRVIQLSGHVCQCALNPECHRKGARQQTWCAAACTQKHAHLAVLNRDRHPDARHPRSVRVSRHELLRDWLSVRPLRPVSALGRSDRPSVRPLRPASAPGRSEEGERVLRLRRCLGCGKDAGAGN
jgi:hypothetical protein